MAPKFGELSVKIEERAQQAYQAEAMEEVREEYPKYIEALTKHPRMLVGEQVPSLRGDGMETLRDSADAREWQEAVKAMLTEEIRANVDRRMEESRGELQTLHASIELFQNNPDLVPGTKQFDRELADKVMQLAKPYELRVEGKLQGFSIPVQPLVEQLRAQLKASRAAAPPPAPAAPAPAAPAAPAPQAGIRSKAGVSSEEENFDTLFGTIGLSGLRF